MALALTETAVQPLALLSEEDIFRYCEAKKSGCESGRMSGVVN